MHVRGWTAFQGGFFSWASATKKPVLGAGVVARVDTRVDARVDALVDARVDKTCGYAFLVEHKPLLYFLSKVHFSYLCTD